MVSGAWPRLWSDREGNCWPRQGIKLGSFGWHAFSVSGVRDITCGLTDQGGSCYLKKSTKRYASSTGTIPLLSLHGKFCFRVKLQLLLMLLLNLTLRRNNVVVPPECSCNTTLPLRHFWWKQSKAGSKAYNLPVDLVSSHHHWSWPLGWNMKSIWDSPFSG